MKSGTCIGKTCKSWKPVFETRLGRSGRAERSDKVIDGVARCSRGGDEDNGLVFCKSGVPCSEASR